jgi:beta-lactamase class D
MIFRLLFLFILMNITSSGQDEDSLLFKDVNLSELFSGIEGTFVMLDSGSDTLFVYNRERVQRSFLPASTFKIPNSVIALETGIVKDDDTIVEWDSLEVPWKSRWPLHWKKGQTLESAFKNSIVWYYQRLAQRIGEERMQDYLNKFNYGNKNMGGGIDHFWLEGEIRISPLGQIRFLDNLFSDQYDISATTLNTLKRIMNIKQTDNYTIYGKTGTASVTSTRYLGWLVGFIEKEQKIYYYALNIEGETVWQQWPPHKRVELLEDILERIFYQTGL